MKAWALVLTVLVVVLSSSMALAVPINPFPGFAPDDGTELFQSLRTLSAELLDPLQGVTSFGLYFADGSGQVPIFGPDDIPTNDIPGGAPTQIALVDFVGGQVIDIDTNPAVAELLFAGSGPFGFLLAFDGGPTIFSQSALNPNGGDFVGTFRSLNDSSVYLIGFEVPGIQELAVFELTVGVRPVPEPASAALLLGALLSLGLATCKRRSDG